MTINRINLKQLSNQKSELPSKRNNYATSFKGCGFVLKTMSEVEAGGFAAAFIAQDMLGLAFPRIGAGLFRNKDETGKCNWKFAAQEAIREFITGPSAIAIPFAVLFGARKFLGQSNAVPAEFIKGIGGQFAEYAKTQTPEALADTKTLKQGFYENAVRNMLETTTRKGLKGKDLTTQVDSFVADLLKIEELEKKSSILDFFKSKKNDENNPKKIMEKLYEKFIALKKPHVGASDTGIKASFTVLESSDGKPLATNFKDFVGHLQNYTADATKSISKKFKTGSVEEFVKNFNVKRMGSRFITNIAMAAATIIFFINIPKMYKQKDGNPGLAGLSVEKIDLNGGKADAN